MPAIEFLLLLALIQGITEFLPVSSSAHLILPAQLWGVADQGLAFDIAVHLGSLLAVLIVMRADIADFTRQSLHSRQRQSTLPSSSPIVAIVIATVPVLGFGFFFADFIETSLRSVAVIAWASIIFGIVLGLSERYSNPARDYSAIKPSSALLIGLAQAAALIPGTSRSGVTMAICLFLGFSKRSAAQFSFLLAIPVILAATSYQTLKIFQQGIGSQELGALMLCTIAAFFCALLSMRLFLRFVERIGYLPFAIYRVLLGLVLLLFFA